VRTQHFKRVVMVTMHYRCNGTEIDLSSHH
jgi:hypothetical protein